MIAPFPPLPDPPLPDPPEPDAPVPDPPDPDPKVGERATQGEASALPHCACGVDRLHPLVSAEPKYGLGAWLRLAIGVSARPERIIYRCRRCHAVVDESTAAETLNESY
jgi:hypothetical protein